MKETSPVAHKFAGRKCFRLRIQQGRERRGQVSRVNGEGQRKQTEIQRRVISNRRTEARGDERRQEGRENGGPRESSKVQAPGRNARETEREREGQGREETRG